MKRTVRVLRLFVFCLTAHSGIALAQNNYLNATGNPSFGVNIPIENGFINVTNGNLHLEFPLATHKQRGALVLNERLVYDSRIWMIGHYSNYYWWPTNIPNTPYTQGGWRFVTGAETGTLIPNGAVTNNGQCGPIDIYGEAYYWHTTVFYSWTDPSGTSHTFDTLWTEDTSDCGNIQPSQESVSGFATDASGYSIQASGTNDGDPTSIAILDNNGTQVYPQVTDRFGNYWSFDSNGNLIDDLGRTPVIVTKNGNVTYYDVLAPNGPINNQGTRVRYTVTTAPIAIRTLFNQQGVTEWSGTLNPIQSIQLPDGTSYTFTYNKTLGGAIPGYGDLASVTLPTGGVITYGWSNYFDSYQNVNRWLTSRTVGNDPPTTFTPKVISFCSSNGTGCQEQMTMHKPSGDETVYQLTLNNGAWNTSTTAYNGSANSTAAIATVENVYDFSHTCPSQVCSGAEYITQSSALTTLYGGGGTAQTQYGYSNPALGKPTSIKQWDYYNSTTPPSTPTRETDYNYTASGFDLHQVTQLDSGGNPVSQTTYSYTTSATPTSSVLQHGTVNAGGPYLQSVSQWLNTGGSVATTYVMDDTGMVTSVTDPKLNPPSTISYQCSNALPNVVSNALGQQTTYAYDCNSGAVTSVKDPNDSAAGRSGTVYQYESAGRLQSVTYPDNGQATYNYPTALEVDTNVTATPDPTISSSDILDSFGRPYQHVSGGVSSETTYDANGRVHCVTNPHFTGSSSSTDGSTCITSYDGLDRPKVETQPDGTTLQWSYNGNIATSTDEAGNSWQRTANAFGQLTKVIEPGNLLTNYSYDGLGNLSNVTQSGVSGETARTRSFSYDSLSRMIQAYDPESGWKCYGTTGGNAPNGSNCTTPGYDANGNLKAMTDARGIITSYFYDALNRLTSKTYSDGTPQSSYTYDNFTGWGQPHGSSIGRLVRTYTCSSVGCEDDLYSYDPMGRINHIEGATPSEAGHAAHWMQMQYDLAGNLTDLLYPNGRVVHKAFDSAGQLSSVNYASQSTPYGSLTGGTPVNSPYVSSIGYLPNGSPQTVLYGNGVAEQHILNNRLQMQSMTAALNQAPFSGRTILSHNYCYSNCTSGGTANNGSIWQIADALNSARTQDFTYDSLSRITGFAVGGATTQQFHNDSFGNMSLVSNGSSLYSFNSTPNRIDNLPCSASSTPYDQAGNQICDTDSNGASRKESYDAEGRLAGITMLGSNQPFESYMYGADGNRVRKNGADGSWTEYIYVNGQPITEKNSDGTWTDYIYANGRKIARVAGTDSRIHTHGVFTTNGNELRWNLPIPSNPDGTSYTITAGDQLCVRQYQSNGVGGPAAGYSDNTSNSWDGRWKDANGQEMNQLQTQNQWVYRCADLSLGGAKTGMTFQWLSLLTDVNTPAGSWDIWYADMAIISTNGTVTQIIGSSPPTPAYGDFQGGGWTGTPTAYAETVPIGSDPTGAAGTKATTYYSLADHLGTTQLESSTGGWPMSSSTFYPFGQEHSQSYDPNHYKFTGLERDGESGMDHAMFRQYSSITGRWMSPDPYNGSMDIRYPQTFNRYSYVGNSPLTSVDPSGLDGHNPVSIGSSVGGCEGAVLSGGGNVAADIGCGLSLFKDIAGLFGGPSFHGSLTPRPNNGQNQIWDEHGGFHATPYSSIASMIGDVGGWYPSGCEFGVCGGGGFGLQQSGNYPNVSVNCRGIETYHLGLIFAQHCDATVSIGDGWLYSLSAGPIDGRLRGFVTKTHTLPTGDTNFWKGRDGLGLAKCLIGAASASQASSDAPQYHPVYGPNSNIWLNGIFSSCGVNLGIKTHGPYF